MADLVRKRPEPAQNAKVDHREHRHGGHIGHTRDKRGSPGEYRGEHELRNGGKGKPNSRVTAEQSDEQGDAEDQLAEHGAQRTPRRARERGEYERAHHSDGERRDACEHHRAVAAQGQQGKHDGGAREGLKEGDRLQAQDLRRRRRLRSPDGQHGEVRPEGDDARHPDAADQRDLEQAPEPIGKAIPIAAGRPCEDREDRADHECRQAAHHLDDAIGGGEQAGLDGRGDERHDDDHAAEVDGVDSGRGGDREGVTQQPPPVSEIEGRHEGHPPADHEDREHQGAEGGRNLCGDERYDAGPRKDEQRDERDGHRLPNHVDDDLATDHEGREERHRVGRLQGPDEQQGGSHRRPEHQLRVIAGADGEHDGDEAPDRSQRYPHAEQVAHEPSPRWSIKHGVLANPDRGHTALRHPRHDRYQRYDRGVAAEVHDAEGAEDEGGRERSEQRSGHEPSAADRRAADRPRTGTGLVEFVWRLVDAGDVASLGRAERAVRGHAASAIWTWPQASVGSTGAGPRLASDGMSLSGVSVCAIAPAHVDLGVQSRMPDAVLSHNLGDGLTGSVVAAAEIGSDWIWIVGHGVDPAPDALARLLAPLPDARALADPAILASKVVLPDGSLDLDAAPWPRLLARELAMLGAEHRLAALRAVRYGSILVACRAVARHGPPRRDFTGASDLEWTGRILRDEPGFLVPASVVTRRLPLAVARRAYVRDLVRILRGDGWSSQERVWFAFRLAQHLVDRALAQPSAVPSLLLGLTSGLLARDSRPSLKGTSQTPTI